MLASDISKTICITFSLIRRKISFLQRKAADLRTLVIGNSGSFLIKKPCWEKISTRLCGLVRNVSHRRVGYLISR